MNFEKKYRYTGDDNLKLNKLKTTPMPKYKDKKEQIKTDIQDDIQKMAARQQMLYAEGTYGVLIVLQAMDAAGKDGMIRHVFSGINPEGCEVTSFKQPSKKELSHDYLWRCHLAMPSRGKIGIFNRSYYEDVLVDRVHPEILAGEHLPGIKTAADVKPKFFKDRYNDINQFENYETRNGFMILKFFLHISKDEQKRRFESRIETPEKNWKFSESDIKERKYWNQYEKAYNDAIESTSSPKNPWYIIPADDKWFSRLVVSKIINARLEKLPLAYPEVTPEQKQGLKTALDELEGGKKSQQQKK
ncbi:hypothetical protein IV38_GL000211 [Lactobacillus selangorensis]|uniref:Polyphosphate kinase-2-related domain-containing protein n=1 Tax=Lactobacillus selangorensis TaxID=81857 RepID=A0A0R2G007_9LACO|nr:polyphosphate kinase 2 family protein [Lactobacillus selangorensis]KRN29328.1 hypothetical protein IV38_GL000211 [Lactobacillus selangorensis]KRN34143.1 hypothetical protein IV40_GL000458 [Lactobacillus selangorensis]